MISILAGAVGIVVGMFGCFFAILFYFIKNDPYG